MSRRLIFLILATLLLSAACRNEQPSGNAPAASETTEQAKPDPGAPSFEEIRARLSEVEPAIPLWSGARAEPDAIRTEPGQTVIDLWTNDSFPMVWHFYVTYLAQYRGWDPLDPFPSKNDTARSLDLVLNDVMVDPFIPGTALDAGAPRILLQVREDPTTGRVRIRYVIDSAS